VGKGGKLTSNWWGTEEPKHKATEIYATKGERERRGTLIAQFEYTKQKKPNTCQP